MTNDSGSRRQISKWDICLRTREQTGFLLLFLSFLFVFNYILLIYLLCVSRCVCACGSQRTIFGGHFSPNIK